MIRQGIMHDIILIIIPIIVVMDIALHKDT